MNCGMLEKKEWLLSCLGLKMSPGFNQSALSCGFGIGPLVHSILAHIEVMNDKVVRGRLKNQRNLLTWHVTQVNASWS